MPQGQYRRPRINFGIDENSKRELEEWAEQEHRTVSNLIESNIETALAQRKLGKQNIKPESSVITEDDLDQIKKFISLLCGDRERDGVSFVLLGQTLGFDPEKLYGLYQMLVECKKDKTKKK